MKKPAYFIIIFSMVLVVGISMLTFSMIQLFEKEEEEEEVTKEEILLTVDTKYSNYYSGDSININGKVVDPNNNPLNDVFIQVRYGDRLKEFVDVSPNSDGIFSHKFETHPDTWFEGEYEITAFYNQTMAIKMINMRFSQGG